MTYGVFLQVNDTSVRRALAEQLLAKNYRLVPEVALADLLLLDLGDAAPGRCAELRDQGVRQPILLLGATSGQARSWGADYALAKPVRFGDLLRHLEQAAPKPMISVGGFRLNANARQMTDDQGRSLRLTEKEAAILTYLAQAGDQAVAREELLGEVWGYAGSATTHTVETHIYRLRRKLQENGGADLLHTEAGGYRLAQQVGK